MQGKPKTENEQTGSLPAESSCNQANELRKEQAEGPT